MDTFCIRTYRGKSCHDFIAVMHELSWLICWLPLPIARHTQRCCSSHDLLGRLYAPLYRWCALVAAARPNEPVQYTSAGAYGRRHLALDAGRLRPVWPLSCSSSARRTTACASRRAPASIRRPASSQPPCCGNDHHRYRASLHDHTSIRNITTRVCPECGANP